MDSSHSTTICCSLQAGSDPLFSNTTTAMSTEHLKAHWLAPPCFYSSFPLAIFWHALSNPCVFFPLHQFFQFMSLCRLRSVVSKICAVHMWRWPGSKPRREGRRGACAMLGGTKPRSPWFGRRTPKLPWVFLYLFRTFVVLHQVFFWFVCLLL